MCGRYSNTLGPEELGRQIGQPLGIEIRDTVDVGAYNIAPTDQVLAIVAPTGRPEARALRWALVPEQAKDLKTGRPHINARLEGLEKTGEFLGVPADATHRALIPASEFMEWAKAERTRGVRPAPFAFTVDGGRAFCFAGLWAVASHVEGGPIASCTILTCDATSNHVVAPIHDRMPVILPDPDEWGAWLAAGVSQEEALSMCRPLPAERMAARPLPETFNDARNKTLDTLFVSTDAPTGT